MFDLVENENENILRSVELFTAQGHVFYAKENEGGVSMILNNNNDRIRREIHRILMFG